MAHEQKKKFDLFNISRTCAKNNHMKKSLVYSKFDKMTEKKGRSMAILNAEKELALRNFIFGLLFPPVLIFNYFIFGFKNKDNKDSRLFGTLSLYCFIVYVMMFSLTYMMLILFYPEFVYRVSCLCDAFLSDMMDVIMGIYKATC